ncbi:MAG: hypothetical protein AXA67_02910 [Methylothermaceae bacteria B42]|nr:MAG: hypothetical protein AXA67_02910 [Methylothermaceae bacteria B42]HHJ38766.1 dihydrofolate reductase [Methylothermaceae bacterium]
MKISMIAAMARNRVIGHQGEMPWHLSADLKRFRQITWGKPILMGRKTFEAIGRPLPGRQNIIVTRNRQFQAPNCTVASSIEIGISLAEGDEVMVIGGAELYEALLPDAETLYLTLIHAEFPGDTFFPLWEPVQWQEISREDHPPDQEGFPHPYSFIQLERV